MRILLIEDNPSIAGMIEEGFKAQGYEVDRAATGSEGENLGVSQNYDTIILDIMLPDQDGVEICRNLRRRGVRTPILMLTALSTTMEKVTGLDAGADDYLTKPFEFDELVARVRALARRGEPGEPTVLRFEDLEMDLLHRTVTRAGHKIRLTTKEFSLLEFLMRNPEKVLSRTAIGENVWDMNFDHESNVIDVYISMLRRKVDRDFEKPLIQTVIGTGYMLSTKEPETGAVAGGSEPEPGAASYSYAGQQNNPVT